MALPIAQGSPGGPIELSEHASLLGALVDEREAGLLRASGTLAVTRGWSGGWDLHAGSHVGVVQINGLEVRITPKVHVGRLLFLLSYAKDPKGWRRMTAAFAESDDLVASVTTGFLHQADQALAQGVLQGYVTVEESLPAIRGRFRAADHLRRRAGISVPVEVTYDEFSPDIPENQLLKAAARRLLRLRRVPAIALRGLRHLIYKLEGVRDLDPSRPRPPVRSSRSNARYIPAVRLAELILDGSSIRSERGGRQAVAFLFDMNRVFEDFLTAALGESLRPFGGRVLLQDADHLDEARQIGFRPDLSWWLGRHCLAVVDAKYKRADAGAVHNADVYQVLAYCVSRGVRNGYLLYPADEGAPTLHRIRNSDIDIIVATIDLSLAPEDLLGSIDRLAGSIATREQRAS